MCTETVHITTTVYVVLIMTLQARRRTSGLARRRVEVIVSCTCEMPVHGNDPKAGYSNRDGVDGQTSLSPTPLRSGPRHATAICSAQPLLGTRVAVLSGRCCACNLLPYIVWEVRQSRQHWTIGCPVGWRTGRRPGLEASMPTRHEASAGYLAQARSGRAA